MNELVFYTNPMSRGRIVRWMLEETGIEYATEVLEYGPAMKQEPFISINPMGKVPAIRHGASVVTECAAICAYLADVYPAAGLAPEPDNRADYYRWLFFAAGPVECAITNFTLGFNTSTEQSQMAGYGTYDQMLNVLEYALTDRKFIAGDRFSAADVYIGSHVGWGLQTGTLPKRDAFTDYFAGLSLRPAWQRATDLDDALINSR